MSVIYVLLTISVAVAVIFFAAFVISVKNGQYDDSYTPSVRMLFEDELVNPEVEKQNSNSLENIETSTFKRRGRIERREKTKHKKVSSPHAMFSSTQNNIQINKPE